MIFSFRVNYFYFKASFRIMIDYLIHLLFKILISNTKIRSICYTERKIVSSQVFNNFIFGSFSILKKGFVHNRSFPQSHFNLRNYFFLNAKFSKRSIHKSISSRSTNKMKIRCRNHNSLHLLILLI